MLSAPNEKVLSALARFQNDADWLVVRDWLKESMNTSQQAMNYSRDEVSVRWAQGGLQALDELLTIAEQAPGAVFRMRQRVAP